MSKMIVDGVRRTGSATSQFRQLEVIQGEGKKAVRRVLSTPIEKLGWAPEFRHGKSAVPVEQYAFKVAGRIVERFADATAIVLKRHNVVLADYVPAHELQTYVRKAVAIMNGTESLHVHNDPLPADAAPAIVTFTQEAL